MIREDEDESSESRTNNTKRNASLTHASSSDNPVTGGEESEDVKSGNTSPTEKEAKYVSQDICYWNCRWLFSFKFFCIHSWEQLTTFSVEMSDNLVVLVV